MLQCCSIFLPYRWPKLTELTACSIHADQAGYIPENQPALLTWLNRAADNLLTISEHFRQLLRGKLVIVIC